MQRHTYIWMFAISCAMVALGFGAARYATDLLPAADAQRAHEATQQALHRLTLDPEKIEEETQRALRKAAVLVEEEQSQNAEGLYLLGQQHMREMDYDGAEALFRQSMNLAPDWARPHAALGRLLARYTSDRLEEAEHELKTAKELAPDSWDAYDALALVYRKQKRHKDALPEAEQAVTLAPELVGPHNNLANLYLQLERYEEAEQHFQAAIELDSNHAKPHYNLACLYARTDRHDEALEKLEQALQLNPVLRRDAASDSDLKPLRKSERFKKLFAPPVEAAEATGATPPEEAQG